MKAEHRKELETNLLADRMGKLMQRMRTRPQRRSILIGLLVVVVVIALVMVSYWREERRSMLANRWYVLERGTDVFSVKEELNMDWLAGFRFVPKGAKGQQTLELALTDSEFDNPGKAARFEVARYCLWDLGVKRLAHLDRFQGDRFGMAPFGRIAMAESLYKKLETECENEPEWKAEALYGLAVIDETRSLQANDVEKHLAKAREKYKSLADLEVLKKTGHGRLAEKRYKDLKDRFAETSAFYQNLKRELNIQAPPPPKQERF